LLATEPDVLPLLQEGSAQQATMTIAVDRGRLISARSHSCDSLRWTLHREPGKCAFMVYGVTRIVGDAHSRERRLVFSPLTNWTVAPNARLEPRDMPESTHRELGDACPPASIMNRSAGNKGGVRVVRKLGPRFPLVTTVTLSLPPARPVAPGSSINCRGRLPGIDTTPTAGRGAELLRSAPNRKRARR
jgi:hypothetical protein